MKDVTSRKTNEANLKFISNLIREVEHFVFFGTLLGLVRDGQLIEYDDDIDFYVNIRYRDDLLAIVMANGFSVDFSEFPNDTKFFLQLSRDVDGEMGLIDIYFFEDAKNPNFIFERTNFSGYATNEKSFLRFRKDDIFPIATYNFEGVDINVPRKSQEIVEFIYGKRWNEPLRKGTQYTMLIVNNKPWIFIGRMGIFRRKIIKLLGILNLLKVG